MTYPFELANEEIEAHLDDLVDVTFGDLQSHFLVLPKGNSYIQYRDFQDAYEALKRHTNAFERISEDTIWAAFRHDSLSLVVLRTVLGLSPPEWADLAVSETGVEIPQNAARTLDTRVRRDRTYLNNLDRAQVTRDRVQALVQVAVQWLRRGAPLGAADTVHRLAKFDTERGIDSVRHAAQQHVPYAVLLYERYLGRPFASHRDSVSELVGDVMENAIEGRLLASKISFRRTKGAERIPGFDQAPDFFIPTEVAPRLIIEAKITQDDGTARDKVARIFRLAAMRDERERKGEPGFEVVACIDGRGFGIRRNDMYDIIRATRGKVFTLATVDRLVENTVLKDQLPVE